MTCDILAAICWYKRDSSDGEGLTYGIQSSMLRSWIAGVTPPVGAARGAVGIRTESKKPASAAATVAFVELAGIGVAKLTAAS